MEMALAVALRTVLRTATARQAVRRPHPGSPIKPYDTAMMQKMLNLQGKVCLGYLDNYEDTLVYLDETDKGIIPRMRR